MFHLVYLSNSVALFELPDLLELLEKARVKNSRLGITGMLLYKQGSVIQVLEGEEQAVRDLFETIRQDPRHTGVTVIAEEHVTERTFGDWSMAFRDVDAGGKIEGFSDFLETPWTEDQVRRDPSLAKTLLNLFKWCLTER